MRFNEKATRNYQRQGGRGAKTWAIASFVGLVGTPRMTRAAFPKKSESSGFILRSAQIISPLFRRFVSDYLLVQNVLLSASRPPRYPRSSGCELHQCAIQNELESCLFEWLLSTSVCFATKTISTQNKKGALLYSTSAAPPGPVSVQTTRAGPLQAGAYI